MPLHLDPATCEAMGFRPDGIADLSRLGLSQESILARRKFIGGSDATIIGHGDWQAVNKLAEIKRGLRKPDDLSKEIYVQLGIWTEPFVLAWAETKLHARIERRGERIFHPRHTFLAATLDGWLSNYKGGQWVVQAKHVNAYSKPRGVLAFYNPQLQHEIAVTGADGGLLVMLIGTMDFRIFEVEPDIVVSAHLLDAERDFMRAVRSGYAPRANPVPPPSDDPVPVARSGERDMETTPQAQVWAEAAAAWTAERQATERLEKARLALRKLVPPGVQRAYGAGIVAAATKAGAIKITPLTSTQEFV